MYNTNTRRGFTLIELLVVVLIIAVLAAIALPQYQKAVEKSRAAQAIALLRAAHQAAVLYYLEHGAYPSSFQEMNFEVPWTGDTKWCTLKETSYGIQDTKSNEDWSLQLYLESSGNLQIYLGRISGKYAGAGFILPSISSTTGTGDGTIECAERKRAGITFSTQLNPGDYCEKIMKGRVNLGFGGSYRQYRLP